MSLTVSKNSMGNLPTVLAQNVQTFLSHEEAFGAMRLVCQSWKHLVPLVQLIIEHSEQFSHTHLASLSTPPSKPTVWKDIHFNFCPEITSEAFEILLKNKQQPRRLELIECRNIRSFGFLSSFPLEECELARVGIKDSDLQGLKMPHLEKLELRFCRDLSGSCFAGVEFPFLKSLAMDGTPIIDSAFALIKKMPLTHLSLACCSKVSNIGISSLADMPLVVLNLRGTGVTDDGIEGLMSGSVKNTLTDLNLFSSSITDKSISLLGKRLQKLDLSYARSVSNDALRRLSDWAELNELQLDACSIDDSGLVFLQKVPIRHLSLMKCEKISDAGLESLASMPLQELGISGCSKVTGKGLERLPASIKGLSAYHCPEISSEDFQAFKARTHAVIRVSLGKD